MNTTSDSSSSEDSALCDILVVDDTAENLTAMGVALEGLSCRLIMARSGHEALRELLRRDFALIFLDVQMPHMDGFETARMIRAREKTRHVPIIFLTAHAPSDPELLEAYRLGAVDFLTKPLPIEILKAKAEVFSMLQGRTRQAERQSAQIRTHVLNERELWLAEQRARLEGETLKSSLDEQRAHAAELRALSHQLLEADRRKDEFIAVLGHELRNPLAALVSGIELLPTATEEALAVMRRQVEHLVHRADALLDMSKVSRGKIELRRSRVRAGKVLDGAVALALPLLTRHEHALTIERGAEHDDLFVDELRAVQVVANLLDNAARYTAPHGRITLGCRSDDGGVTYWVKDNGRGISPELLPRIFDLFVQERTGIGGLGIGLTLVKQLTQLHEGRVDARSEGTGMGSEFSVWLPLCPPDVASAPSSARPKSGERRALHVALIDDNDDARLVLGEVLSSWGHRVSQAAAGAAGAHLIVSSRPDVAFIDIGLPDIDGFEVARQVTGSLGVDSPLLVALSGFGRLEDRERALGAGFHHHLTKPASSTDLKRLLSNVDAPREARAAGG
ncbi:MAG TPA: response regulator [Polyangiaceae bacterium]|nr:response regulator [Polyangiaceae bacterium]